MWKNYSHCSLHMKPEAQDPKSNAKSQEGRIFSYSVHNQKRLDVWYTNDIWSGTCAQSKPSWTASEMMRKACEAI